MRLWHEALIPYLSNKRLCGQHRECCALRGKGWGRKHATVNYVFKYGPLKLYKYHIVVMLEMLRRGFHIDAAWTDMNYRGKHCEMLSLDRKSPAVKMILNSAYGIQAYTYPEHNDAYLKECLELLDKKGEHIEWKQK